MSILHDNYGRPDEDQGLKCKFFITLLINIDSRAARDGNARLCELKEDEAGALLCKTGNHSFAVYKEPDFVAFAQLSSCLI